MAAATFTSRLPDNLPLMFNRGWAESAGVAGVCVCVTERVLVFSVGGHCSVSGFYCAGMRKEQTGGDSNEWVSGV